MSDTIIRDLQKGQHRDRVTKNLSKGVLSTNGSQAGKNTPNKLDTPGNNSSEGKGVNYRTVQMKRKNSQPFDSTSNGGKGIFTSDANQTGLVTPQRRRDGALNKSLIVQNSASS